METGINWKNRILLKLTSTKFWVAVGTGLLSMSTTISGLATQNESLTTVGIICVVVGGGIYTAATAYQNGKEAEATAISSMTETKQ